MRDLFDRLSSSRCNVGVKNLRDGATVQLQGLPAPAKNIMREVLVAFFDMKWWDWKDPE